MACMLGGVLQQNSKPWLVWDFRWIWHADQATSHISYTASPCKICECTICTRRRSQCFPRIPTTFTEPCRAIAVEMDSSTGCPAWRNECHSHSQPQLSLANLCGSPADLHLAGCGEVRVKGTALVIQSKAVGLAEIVVVGVARPQNAWEHQWHPSFIRTPMQRYEMLWDLDCKVQVSLDMQLDATRCNHKKKRLFSYVSPKRPSAPDAWLVFHLQFHERWGSSLATPHVDIDSVVLLCTSKVTSMY